MFVFVLTFTFTCGPILCAGNVCVCVRLFIVSYHIMNHVEKINICIIKIVALTPFVTAAVYLNWISGRSSLKQKCQKAGESKTIGYKSVMYAHFLSVIPMLPPI